MKIGKFKKEYLFVLAGLLLIGIAFSAIQIVNALPGTATIGSKPNPGHSWNEIANFSCPTGECLQSNSGGTLTCAPCGLTGSGTTNYITKWTGSNSLGNSQIYDDGTNVGIGTTNSIQKLGVNGNIAATGAIIPGTYLNMANASQGIFDANNTFGANGQVLTKASNGVVWLTPIHNFTFVTGSWITVPDRVTTSLSCPGSTPIYCGVESYGSGSDVVVDAYIQGATCYYTFYHPWSGDGYVRPRMECMSFILQ